MWPRAFVYILDFKFIQNFDTKRGNALSWEILSLNHCALFIIDGCYNPWARHFTVHFSLLMGAIILGQGTSLCTFHY